MTAPMSPRTGDTALVSRSVRHRAPPSYVERSHILIPKTLHETYFTATTQPGFLQISTFSSTNAIYGLSPVFCLFFNPQAETAYAPSRIHAVGAPPRLPRGPCRPHSRPTDPGSDHVCLLRHLPPNPHAPRFSSLRSMRQPDPRPRGSQLGHPGCVDVGGLRPLRYGPWNWTQRRKHEH